MTSSTPSPPHQHPIMYQNIIPDIQDIIFHYHVFEISTDPKWGYNAVVEKSDISDPYASQMASCLDPQDPEWKFLIKYSHCISFSGIRKEMDPEDVDKVFCDDMYSCDIEYAALILTYCKDRIQKPHFSYVNLQDVNFLFLRRKSTVHLLGGIRELDSSTVFLPEEYCLGDFPWNVHEAELLLKSIRGIKILNHNTSLMDIPISPFADLRGVKDLTLHGLHLYRHSKDDNAFDELRGIRKLRLLDVQHCSLTSDMLSSLRGVQEFKAVGEIAFDNLEQGVENLRGIQKFKVDTFDDFALTDKCFENFRGIKSLCLSKSSRIIDLNYAPSLLTNASFENLRGVQELKLSTHSLHHNITDTAFINLRGARKLYMKNFPQITSAIFENLRGIKHLEIRNCDNLRFTSNALYNLRGIRHLVWLTYSVDGQSKKLLQDECMEHLYGVEYLLLNHVVTVCDEAFRHLRKTKSLVLRGTDQIMKNHPLTDAAFSQMPRMEKIVLTNMRLNGVRNFPRLIETLLPKLRSLQVYHCVVSNLSLTEQEDTTVKLCRLIIHNTLFTNARDCVVVSFTYKRIGHRGEQ